MKYTSLPTLVLLFALLLIACESQAPGDDSPTADEDITQACYHFETRGQIEFSATCRDYNVADAPDGGLRLTLMQPPVALTLYLPEDLAIGQYDLVGTDSDADDQPRVEVLYNPLDAPDELFRNDVQGRLTLMRIDDSGISALFDFSAEPGSPATPEGIQVRGHLRDLPLTPQ